MKKTNIKAGKYLLWLFFVPLAATVILSLAFSLLNKNYYYLPYSLDFTIQLSYDLQYVFLLAEVFLSIGIIADAVFFGKVKNILISIITAVAASILLPTAAYFIKFFVLSSAEGEEMMREYFISDILCAGENIIRLAAAVLVIFAAKFFVEHKGNEIKFISASPIKLCIQQYSFLIYYALWLVLSIVTFLFSEEKRIGALLYELCLCVGGYFLSNLGVIIFRKSEENS